MVHQTAHWQAKGNSFYGDHLLFQRLYEESQEGIDGVAERLIGLTGDVSKVSLCDQIRDMHTIAKVWHGHCGDDLAAVSLRGEMALIKLIAFFKKSLQDEGSLTEGLDDLLQGIASKHEEFVYLLKQRSSRPVYNYGR
jgi:DNA-binding ferritin-like protein